MVDMRTREGRQSRETQTRESESREEAWKPPSKLPDPAPRDGIRYRWVRTTYWGQQDPSNVSMRFREGWVPCKKEDHPDLSVITDHNSKFPDNIEIGGLLLCQIDEKKALSRQEYYERLAANQLKSMDHNLMREQHPSMPILKPQRSSRTTFGGGGAPR